MSDPTDLTRLEGLRVDCRVISQVGIYLGDTFITLDHIRSERFEGDELQALFDAGLYWHASGTWGPRPEFETLRRRLCPE